MNSILKGYANGLYSNNIIGPKTGFTNDAGHCLASIAIYPNSSYLLITTGVDPNEKRGIQIENAYNIYNYFDNRYLIIKKGDTILELNTKYGNKDKVVFYSEDDFYFDLESNYKKEDFKVEYIGIDILKSNLKKGDIIGDVNILYKNNNIGKIKIKLNEDIGFNILKFTRANILFIFISITYVYIISKYFITKVFNR